MNEKPVYKINETIEESLWEVNIGDGDILKVRGINLAVVEQKINRDGQFTSDMINSVKKLGYFKFYPINVPANLPTQEAK